MAIVLNLWNSQRMENTQGQQKPQKSTILFLLFLFFLFNGGHLFRTSINTIYFTEGDKEEAQLEDYHSHNTQQKDIKQMEELLLTLPEVQDELKKN